MKNSLLDNQPVVATVPAVTGAQPTIPYGRQSISDADIEAVAAVLRSDFLTQGPAVPAFEKAVAGYCNAAYGVAMNSATSALHVACLALDVGPGDRVWTSPNTFVASANCARYCGAMVDFVDIDPKSWNLCPEHLETKLKTAAKRNELPKVVIPVHFSGEPCDMAAIHALAQQYGFRIIEDASHAIGARYRDTVVGDCQYSDITIFSFHPVKIITTAEGGLATTQSPALARKLQRLRTHGITREASEMHSPNEGPWYYEQIELGFNYRMTDMQAALGTSQMQHLDEWIARRHQLASRYDRLLGKLDIGLPMRAEHSRSALHLYCIQADQRRTVFEQLRARGIGVNVHYIPVHLQPDFQRLGFRKGMYPNSEAYYDRAISLPMYATLSDQQQDRVVHELEQAVR